MKIRYYLMLRQFVRHPWQVMLSITGIALGVGIVLAIDLTNASSERAFIIATQAVAGDISHQIIADDGNIDESLYADLRKIYGLRELMPIVEGRISTGDNERIQLIGIDPVALIGSRHIHAAVSMNGSPFTLILETGSVFISRQLKQQLQIDVKSKLEVEVKGNKHTLYIAGLIPDGDDLQNQALSSSIITDITTAQTVLGMTGKLSRIDLVLNESEVKMLDDVISPPLQLMNSGFRGNAMLQMTRAFRINLTALSLLALVIGAFLIYNTMTISVLQRRELIATLRTLGLKRSELLILLMGEAMLLAVAGLLLGYGLGIGLSHYLIKLASRTMSDLYFVNEVQTIYFSGWSFAKATILGLGATLLASLFPVMDALAIAPQLTRSRSRLEKRTKSFHRTLFIIAILFACIAFIILFLSDKSIVAGFAALAFIIMAFAMLGPLLLVLLINLAKPMMISMLGLAGAIASRSVLSSLSRTQVAVTALAIAISATIGVSIMISSFRLSVQDWLTGLLQADVYISSVNSGPSSAIGPQLIARIKRHPGIEKITTSHRQRLWQNETPIQLIVRDIDAQVFSGYRFKQGSNNKRWQQFTSTDSVIVSEPYAYHQNITVGDSIRLPTHKGTQSFKVAGVYIDYSSDRGIVSMHRDVYENWWDDHRVSSLSLYMNASSDIDKFVRDLNRNLLAQHNLRARANRSLRDLSMQIFDRTFAITEVLRGLTIVIAFIGILGALMAIQLERGREFAVLRAIGMTPWELKKLILSESGLMGTAAGLIAIPLGVMLSAVLIYVINRRSFGWTMDLILSPQYLLSAVILGLIAGVLAGIYPAWRMASTPPATALHDE